MKRTLIAFAALAAISVSARTVTLGTYVCNDEASVSVPVLLDDPAGLAFAGVRINYDPQVLVFTKAEQGTLAEVFDDDFLQSDDGAGSVTISCFRKSESGVVPIPSAGGSLAVLTFAVRSGTAAQYSDLAIANVDLGDAGGVRDVTVGNPTETSNGMVRVFSESASVTRLEGAQTVLADSRLGALSLQAGDAIQASADCTPIVVRGEVVTAAPIRVAAPDGGWTGGAYRLLRTATAGLSFVGGPDGSEPLAVTETRDGGVSEYVLEVEASGPEIVGGAEGETLTASMVAYVQKILAGQLDGVSRVVVNGGTNNVALARDLGIAPKVGAAGKELSVEFGRPSLRIVAFDYGKGMIRAKVTPADGNTIAGDLVTGVIRIKGQSTLTAPSADLPAKDYRIVADEYGQPGTQGEFDCCDVQFGSSTFFRVAIMPESGEK